MSEAVKGTYPATPGGNDPYGEKVTVFASNPSEEKVAGLHSQTVGQKSVAAIDTTGATVTPLAPAKAPVAVAAATVPGPKPVAPTKPLAKAPVTVLQPARKPIKS